MKEPTQHSYYRDKKYPCMTSTQVLVEIHKDSASKSWSKYAKYDKVGKVNYVILNQNDSCNCFTCKNNPGFQRSLELKMY